MFDSIIGDNITLINFIIFSFISIHKIWYIKSFILSNALQFIYIKDYNEAFISFSSSSNNLSSGTLAIISPFLKI